MTAQATVSHNSLDPAKELEQKLRTFGAANFEKYQQFYYDSATDPTDAEIEAAGIVCVTADDNWFCNPFYSQCARYAVDPVETYGLLAFNQWCEKAHRQIEEIVA